MPNYAGFRRSWTEDELIQIEVMLQAGEPVHVIARQLGRPVYAVRNRHEIVQLRQGVVFERGEVARLFGVNDKTAVYWQKRGWLPRKRNGASSIERQRQDRVGFRVFFKEVTGFEANETPSEPFRPGKHSAYLITLDAIHAFIENRDTWVAWEPAQIADESLRAYAQELRQLADGHWLTTAEVAARLGYSSKTVCYWRYAQYMHAVRTVKYGSAVFFWSADLEQWIPPSERLGGSKRTESEAV